MINQRFLVLIVRSITAPIPRIKGLGILFGLVANMFRRHDVTVEVPVLGSRMRLNTSDLIGNMLIFTPNYYDHAERSWLRKIVKPGDYVIDVGANIGAYSLFLARLVTSTGSVIAIEAEQRNAALLHQNIKLNGLNWVVVKQIGVSDKEEVLSLLLNSTGNAGAHSFFEQSDTAAPPTQQVTCKPLLDIIGPRTPKFMKLDIEGFEHRVLARYFADAPQQSWPQYILLEDFPERREADSVALVTSVGYAKIGQQDHNVLLKKNATTDD